MATAIKVEDLSKVYRLGEIGTGTIGRDLERFLKMKILKQEDPFLRIGEANNRATKGVSDIVYSLKNINFDIKQGDAVGIIGRNGAGKSTLLKILSRVTSPTTGNIKIKGRVASLLEVGTGFHPELTGRENIYLNGAILGMRKNEIHRKFDEIVDFSGVERYIDTPVKRYSSGMYVRLAFAVAAHLESEILIVDEVLAVGDVEFQKKCLGKIGEVTKGEGRTVLFVSHNLHSIASLCHRSILLTNGQLCLFDTSSNVIKEYTKLDKSRLLNVDFNEINDTSTFDYYVSKAFLEKNGQRSNTFSTNDEIEINIEINKNNTNSSVIFNIIVFNEKDEKIFSIYEYIHSNLMSDNSIREHVKIIIGSNFLSSGSYYLEINTHIPGQVIFQKINRLCEFEIFNYNSKYDIYPTSNNGYVLPIYKIVK
jgi:lipopolysaccharide transport system ATP-binding protein